MTKLTTLPRIIFFGDSLTQYGWSYDGGWLSIIADALVRQVDVIGRGYSGYNTRMCRSMLPHLFPDAASLGSCRMFTIFLGANDASTLGQNVPVEEYESNLTAMIQHVKTLGVSQDRILLITLPPADVDVWNAKQRAEGKPPNREFKFCPIYAAACKSVALSNDVKFVNLFEMMYAEENWKTFFHDGLHFSRPGSQFLADLLIPLLLQLLTDCPVQWPRWDEVDMMCPSKTLDAYKDGK